MVGRSYPSQEGHPMASPIKTRGEEFIVVLSVSFQRTHQNTSLTAEPDGQASSRLEVGEGASAVRLPLKYSTVSSWKLDFFQNCSILECCLRICDKMQCNTAVEFCLLHKQDVCRSNYILGQMCFSQCGKEQQKYKGPSCILQKS